MKTIVEEINDIKNAEMSKAAKKRALVSLGLLPYEVKMVMATLPETPSAIRARYTFGVEIECYVPRNSVRDAASQTGLSYEYEGYNHRDGHSHFKFVTDASLRGMSDPIECVSPVLQGSDGKKKLESVCKTLNIAGARVDRCCGLHVHIGASSLTESQYCNVFYNYACLQSIVNGFMAPSRRDNGYARPIVGIRFDAVKRAATRSDICSALHHNRYYAVNCMSYDRHKTIEFRQHGGTTNHSKIANWVSFCGKLVEWSKKHRFADRVTSIDEIPFLTAAEKEFFKQRTARFAAE